MRTLVLALICGVVLTGATWLARTDHLGRRPATTQVILLIAAGCTGVLLVVALGWWLDLELDAAMLTALGVFFLGMAWTYTRRTGAVPVAQKPLLPRLTLGILGLVLVGAAVRRSAGIEAAIAHCRAAYAAAQIPADSLAIDGLIPPGSPEPIGKYGRTMTCGRYRTRLFTP